MKWAEMSTEEKNSLIHEKVMGKPVKCSGKPVTTWKESPSRIPGQFFKYATYHCPVCGRAESREAPEEHEIPQDIPPYTTSMDAAWQVVKRVNRSDSPDYHDYGTYARFIDALQKTVGSDLFFDLFYCDDEGDHLTPERICFAALKACGVDIE